MTTPPSSSLAASDRSGSLPQEQSCSMIIFSDSGTQLEAARLLAHRLFQVWQPAAKKNVARLNTRLRV